MVLRDAQPGELLRRARSAGSRWPTRSPRTLVQGAGGVAVGLALDATVGRVRRGRGDARELERAGVDPDAVAVAVREVRRTVGHDAVEHLPRSASRRGSASIDQPPPMIHGRSGCAAA